MQPEPNPDHFHALLELLGSTPHERGSAYERLHRKLQKVFEARGMGVDAVDLADATLDRAARNIAREPGIVIHNIQGYVLTTAHYILLEHIKKPRFEVLDNDPEALDSGENQTSEIRSRCLDRCLAELNPQERETILKYYADERAGKIRNRRKLAESLRMSDETLRVHVYRIRRALERCLVKCIGMVSW